MGVGDQVYPAEIVVKMLLANAGVVALVTDRVWWGRIPEQEISSMPRQAISVFIDQGLSEVYLPFTDVTVQLRCYGSDEVEAADLYLATRGIFSRRGTKFRQTVETGTAMVLHSHEFEYGTLYYEEKFNWPFVLSRFTFEAWEVAVI